ncbi:MAG: betaine/proline/choline family ABC transporter ATP-binding protein [Candidatus Izimaplasma sp.]|nr:betaine/proline/choline family ABC transporter ATP-binding protein [Candidatus Izimaplasma bacterium]
MNNPKIQIKDLELVFGKGKKLKKGIELLHDGASNQEIREKTTAAVGVRKADFSVKEGEMFVIVGLSGSGKSSLIRCMNLLNMPTHGSVEIDGENILDYNKAELIKFRQEKISMVFQHFGLLSHRTVLENVEYGLEVSGFSEKDRDENARKAIDIVGLEGWEDYYPDQLSGGMKQRVGLARALANDPEILLMDEPYSALDPLIRREMQEELLNLEEYMDKTIVFITHDMNEAFKMGDRIALMKDGVIVQLGKPNEFFENPASDYVEDFIADVDKTQILKAKQVMNDVPVVFKKGMTRKKVIKQMEKHELYTGYIVDDDNKFIGSVTIDFIKSARHKKIDDLIKTDVQSFYRQRYLKEIIPLMDECEFDIPIVDSKNRLRGTIDKDLLISSLN